MDLIPRAWKRSSRHSIPRSRPVSAWASPSADRLWKITLGNSGPRRTAVRAPPFSSPSWRIAPQRDIPLVPGGKPRRPAKPPLYPSHLVREGLANPLSWLGRAHAGDERTRAPEGVDERRLEIPIIFITSYVENDVITRIMAGGAVDCLTKPFSENSLLNAISLALPG